MKKKVFLFLCVFLFVLSLSCEVFAQPTPVAWGDFLQSLSNILGISWPLPSGKKKTDPVLRFEAIKTMLQVLSYDDLLSFVDTTNTVFKDIEDLSDEEKRWILLAASLEPPLIRGDVSGRVFPRRALTTQEFVIIKETLKNYALGTIRFERRKSIHPHLELVVKKWGFSPLEKQSIAPPTPNPGETFFLQAGAYESKERAERVAGWLKELGYGVVLHEEGGLFKVRVGPYPKESLKEVQNRLERQGFPSHPVFTRQGKQAEQALPPGPFFTMALLFDPEGAPFRLEVALAKDRVVDREKTSEIAKRKGALFAMNASFFIENGDPIGLFMVGGKILSEPQKGWYSLGITDENHVVIGETRLECRALGGQGEVGIDGINRLNNDNEVVFYDAFFGDTTPAQEGVEVIVRRGVVEEVRLGGTGKTPIPQDGFVLLGRGKAGQALRQAFFPGDHVRVKMTLYSPPEQLEEWRRVRYAISGGPLLFSGGQPGPFGDFNPDIVAKRHPRAVSGTLEDGRILFWIVDGRRPGHSVGMTIEEVVQELQSYNVRDALNLDGGGSTTFYLEGRVLNLPSDLVGERKVSSAILLIP